MEDTKYASSSDVWSFGVVLFEMWSLGKKPYGGMNNHDVSVVVPARYLWFTYTFPNTMDSHTHIPQYHRLTYTHSPAPVDSHTHTPQHLWNHILTCANHAHTSSVESHTLTTPPPTDHHLCVLWTKAKSTYWMSQTSVSGNDFLLVGETLEYVLQHAHAIQHLR